MEPAPDRRQQEARRQMRKEEKLFDITDINNPEGVFHIFVGGDINGGPDRLHGGIVSTLLDHCMGLFLTFAYGARTPPTVELTIKFKKPITTPCVFMLKTRVKREVGRWIETVGWVEDGYGTVFAEGSATYVAAKVEQAKLR
jgi:acyl-coenzyme A thioesterase PaaI-like protein